MRSINKDNPNGTVSQESIHQDISSRLSAVTMAMNPTHPSTTITESSTDRVMPHNTFDQVSDKIHRNSSTSGSRVHVTVLDRLMNDIYNDSTLSDENAIIAKFLLEKVKELMMNE